MLIRIMALAVVLAATGCITQTTSQQPFTDDWAYVSQHEDKAPNIGGEVVLSGPGDRFPPATLRVDERGNPGLELGKNSRWRPEVTFKGGPRVGVKYKREF